MAAERAVVRDPFRLVVTFSAETRVQPQQGESSTRKGQTKGCRRLWPTFLVEVRKPGSEARAITGADDMPVGRAPNESLRPELILEEGLQSRAFVKRTEDSRPQNRGERAMLKGSDRKSVIAARSASERQRKHCAISTVLVGTQRDGRSRTNAVDRWITTGGIGPV